MRRRVHYCGVLVLLWVTAAMGCEVAINAGFFNRGTGDCVGNVITHGHRVQISGLENVNFGIMQVC